MIQTHHWLMMLHIVPEDLKQLVGSCYEYQELLAYLESVNKITGKDIGDIQILIQRVMSEYMKVVQLQEKDDKIINKIRSDMETTLSNWFEKSGHMKDLSQPFLMSMERGQLHFHLPMFVTPTTGFIHSKIYQSLVEAYTSAYHKPFLRIEKLEHYVPERDWNTLGKQIHTALCRACYDFEEFMFHVMKIAPYYSKREDGIREYWLPVVEEYLKIVRSSDKILVEILSPTDMLKFTHAVYYYLQVAKGKHDSTFINTFITSTKYKAGILPEIVKDGKGGLDSIKLPKGPKSGEDDWND